MSAQRPHWLVYVLASAMGLVLFGFLALVVLSDAEKAEEATWRWGYVGTDGAVVIPLELEAARGFANQRGAVRRDGLWGFVDRSGSFVVEPRFRQLCDFGGAQPTCAQDAATGQWGYVDPAGAWVLGPEWDAALPMADGVAAVGRHVGTTSTRLGASSGQGIVHYGLIDVSGTEIVPIRGRDDLEAWRGVGPWSEGLAPVQVAGKFGYVDRTGVFVLEPQYRAALPFHEGLAAVSGSGGWAVIDRTGAVVVREQTALADGCGDGVIAGPGGYFTRDGAPLGPRHEWVLRHSEGLGAVMDGNRWGFVDLEGNPVIPQDFNRVSRFADGRAVAAVLDGRKFRWGILDPAGSWVVEPTWRGIDENGFSEGLLAVGEPPPGEEG